MKNMLGGVALAAVASFALGASGGISDARRGECAARAMELVAKMTPEEARKYMAAGEFAPGSMLPKVQAAVEFVESKPGRRALITLLEKAKDGIAGKTGTLFYT